MAAQDRFLTDIQLAHLETAIEARGELRPEWGDDVAEITAGVAAATADAALANAEVGNIEGAAVAGGVAAGAAAVAFVAAWIGGRIIRDELLIHDSQLRRQISAAGNSMSLDALLELRRRALESRGRSD